MSTTQWTEERMTLLDRFLEDKDSGQSDVNITSKDINKLYLHLSNSKLNDAVKSQPEKVNKLQETLNNSFSKLSESEDRFSSLIIDNEDDYDITEFIVNIKTCTMLLNIIHTMENHSHTKIYHSRGKLNEDSLVKLSYWTKVYISKNFVDISTSGDSKEPGTPSRRNLNSQMSSYRKAELSKAVQSLFPPMVIFLECIATYISDARPNVSLLNLFVEISNSVIGIDPQFSINAAYLDQKEKHSLINLQSAGLNLARILYLNNKNCRESLRTSTISSCGRIYSGKYIYRPISTDESSDTVESSRVTAPLVAILTMLQSTSRESQMESCADCLNTVNNTCNNFINELIEICYSKESGYDGNSVLSGILQDLLAAVDSPQYPTSNLMLEQLVIGLVLQLKKAMESEGKRDSNLAGQILQLLSIVAEGIWNFVISIEQPSKEIIDNDVVNNITSRIKAKWELSPPEWLFAADDNDAANKRIKKLPFINQIDACLQINEDINAALNDIQNAGNSKLCNNIRCDGGASLTVKMISQLSSPYELDKLLNEVTYEDILFGRLLKCSIDTGSIRPSANKGLKFTSEKVRDVAMTIAALWGKLIANRSVPQQGKDLLSLLKTIRYLGNANDSSNENEVPNFINNMSFPSQPSVHRNIFKIILRDRVGVNLQTNLLNVFYFMLKDPSPMIRSKLLKTFCKLVQIDPTMLNDESFVTAVNGVLEDKFISVREEGVKLVGIYCVHVSEATSLKLLEMVKHLLYDEGISVRKSVINIYKEFMLTQPDHPYYQQLCLSMLEKLNQPKEEESIKEMITLIFQQVWFTPHFKSFKPKLKASSTGGNSKSNKENYIEQISVQLSELMVNKACHGWVQKLLQDLLHTNLNDTESHSQAKQRRDEAYHHSSRIVKYLVNILLELESSDDSYELPSKTFTSKADFKLSIIATISLLCEAHPPFVGIYLRVFLPYLKGDSSLSSSANAELFTHIIKIVEATAVMEKNLLVACASDINADLTKIALSQGGNTVDAAIRCMSLIASNITGEYKTLFALAYKCFQPLVAIAQTIEQSDNHTLQPQHSAQVQRCLIVLGSICEHSKKCKRLLLSPSLTASENDHEEEENSEENKQFYRRNERVAQLGLSKIDKLLPAELGGACYSAVMFYMKVMDQVIRVRAIQALCKIFSGYARLLLLAQSTNLFSMVLGKSYNEAVHERLLLGVKDLLHAEEISLERKASLIQMKESGVEVSTRSSVLGGPKDLDSDVSLTGFVIQQQLPLFLGYLTHVSPALRYASLQLIATLLRQGMLCPLEVISPLVMLQTDDNEYIRDESLQLLMLQDERHPNFLDNRLLDGWESSYSFQKNTFNNVGIRSIDTLISAFAPLYKSCVQPNRKRRSNFLSGLLRKCREIALTIAGAKSESSSNSKQKLLPIAKTLYQVGKVNYLLSTIAALPFMVFEEVMEIVQFIGRTISNDLGVLLSKTKLMILDLGGEDRKEGGMQPPAVGSKGINSVPGSNSKKPLSSKAYVSEEVELLIAKDTFMQRYNAAIINDDTAHTTTESNSSSSNSIGSGENAKVLAIEDLLRQQLALRCCEAMLRLKAFLKMLYNLTDERCSSFDPSDKSLQDKLPNLESYAEYSPLPSSCPSNDLIGNTQLFNDKVKVSEEAELCFQHVEWAVIDFNRLSVLLHSEPEDFRVSALEGKRRGRRTGAKSGTNSNAQSPSTPTRRAKRGRPSKESLDGEDDDYCSDFSPNTSPQRKSKRASKKQISYNLEEDMDMEG